MKKFLLITLLFFSAQLSHAQTDSLKTPANDTAVPKQAGNVKSASDTLIFDWCETMPEFPGGMSAFNKYVEENIHYPPNKPDAQGTVYIQFVVEKDGSISNVIVKKGIPGAPGLDAEAVRVISSMPKWKPATMDGRVVRCRLTLPVKFK